MVDIYYSHMSAEEVGDITYKFNQTNLTGIVIEELLIDSSYVKAGFEFYKNQLMEVGFEVNKSDYSNLVTKYSKKKYNSNIEFKYQRGSCIRSSKIFQKNNNKIYCLRWVDKNLMEEYLNQKYYKQN